MLSMLAWIAGTFELVTGPSKRSSSRMAISRISAATQLLAAKLQELSNTVNISGKLFLMPRTVLQLARTRCAFPGDAPRCSATMLSTPDFISRKATARAASAAVRLGKLLGVHFHI